MRIYYDFGSVVVGARPSGQDLHNVGEKNIANESPRSKHACMLHATGHRQLIINVSFLWAILQLWTSIKH